MSYAIIPLQEETFIEIRQAVAMGPPTTYTQPYSRAVNIASCSLSIVGHASAQVRGPEARLQLSGSATRGWPAVIIQSGVTVHLRNLVIQGSPLGVLQGRGLAPHAGICIDPFGAILARDGYPGLEDRYLLRLRLRWRLRLRLLPAAAAMVCTPCGARSPTVVFLN